MRHHRLQAHVLRVETKQRGEVEKSIKRPECSKQNFLLIESPVYDEKSEKNFKRRDESRRFSHFNQWTLWDDENDWFSSLLDN